ncbi:MAG: FxLYD domain-containing protein [Candidatus Doudnabacteria bacterium]|nr:FxLYD domain-containing protein [Candidatus Doudnabacteria bacterium]
MGKELPFKALKIKMNLQENERVEELLLIIGDQFRSTSKLWFYAVGIVLIAAIPLQIFLKFTFENVIASAVSPLKITYPQVEHQPLEMTDKKIFDLGDGTYSGYARIKNPNPEWGVPELKYSYQFSGTGGSSIMSAGNMTYVRPASEKVIAFPRFTSPSKPTSLQITLEDSNFIRPRELPVLDLEIQRRSIDSQVDQFIVKAVIVNHSPFKLTRVDLPILLFDGNNNIIGVNYTNINDLNSNESRSFQYTWYNRINNVARVEIIPEFNPYSRDLFGTVPGQDPFDELE